MDASVAAAIKKWPNVPHCYGWLALDARGQWWLRDEQAQAAGAFGSNPASRGTCLRHDTLLAFIARNYTSDARGQWYFQNGPQRVYAQLAVTPWIWRVQEWGLLDYRVHSHTGVRAMQPAQTYVDAAGHLYLLTEHGVGLVHSLDVVVAAAAIDAGVWPQPRGCAAATLELQFGFVRSPSS